MSEEICDSFFLTWKDYKTRQRFVVGKLWFEADKYYFRYVKSDEEEAKYIENYGLDKAEEHGFVRLVPFSEANKTYEADVLFYTFARRLPNRKRPDFESLVAEFGLQPDCTPLELLKATGGRLGTDDLEFIHPVVFEDKTGEFVMEFYIAGWRYYDGEKVIHLMEEGMSVELALEPDNKYDPFAVRVIGPENTMLGYVPVYYSRYLDEVVSKKDYSAWISKIGPKENPQLRLQVRVKGRAPILAALVLQLEEREKRRMVGRKLVKG